jgi:2-oxoglutarate ferredoxin oxidoreductase subunit delta
MPGGQVSGLPARFGIQLGGFIRREKGTVKSPKEKVININREWCKGCGICAAFCPKAVIDLDGQAKACWVRHDDCIRCGLCEMRCPDLAIELEEKEIISQ